MPTSDTLKILNRSRNLNRALYIKVAGRRILDAIQRIAAVLLRHTPLVARILKLPRKRIRSIKKWIEDSRRRLDWIEVCKGPHYELHTKGLVVHRRAPQNVSEKNIHTAFSAERFHALNETFVARLPNAQLLGPNGVVITADNRIVEESTWGMGWLEKDRALTSLALPAVTKKRGHYYTIASPQSEGYSHWLLEVLPRLFAFESLPVDEAHLVVSKELNEWQVESLAILGLAQTPRVVLNQSYLQLETLYFPSYVGDPGNPHPWGCQWLRKRFLENCLPHSRKRRLYITRRHAIRRRVINESELEPILRDKGFELIETEFLSFREKADLFNQAEAVVGPHGAGLTTILFAPQGCKVLEMFDPNHMNVNYYSLADVLQQEYWYIVGRAAETAGAQHRMSGHDDIYISPSAFAKSLAAMLPD